jgi:hypothetical protein
VIGPNISANSITDHTYNGTGVLFNSIDNNQFTMTYTITNPPLNAEYFVMNHINSAGGGTQGYTLTIDPSPNLGLIGQINAKQAEITAKQAEITTFEGWIVTNKKNIKKTQKKIKKEKKAKKKKKFKKSLRKIENRKTANTIGLVIAESELTILQNELANLQSQLL